MNKHRYCAFPLALAAALTLVSCSSVQNKQLAEQGVAKFHQQLDSEEYHSIYTESDERFRRASREADLNAFLAAVHRKLGKVQSADLKSFQVGWFAGRGKPLHFFTRPSSLTVTRTNALYGTSRTSMPCSSVTT
jgi:hypothetical protein